MQRHRKYTLAALMALALAQPANAVVSYTVTIDDPGNQFAGFDSLLTSNLLAAGAAWSQYLTGDTTLDIVVRPDSTVSTAIGRSLSSSFVGSEGAFNIFQQGAAAKVQSGIDGNGASPDIEISLGIGYLRDQLFLDPDPMLRTAPVPTDKTDAVSVFSHELGHAFAFNGWVSGTNGTYPGNYKSAFDQLTQWVDSELFFVGLRAEATYGGPVPITLGNPFHFSNESPQLGSDLIPDLMNGVVFFNGTRYSISPLDLDVLCDTGVPGPRCFAQAVPEPNTWALLSLGLLGAFAMRRKHQLRYDQP